MADPIFIKSVNPSGSPQDDLVGCYFIPKGGGKYNFHVQDHTEKAKDREKGKSFSFSDKGSKWTLSIDKSSTDTVVNGTWGLGLTHLRPGSGDGDDPTYHAQAGTTPDKPKAASAKNR